MQTSSFEPSHDCPLTPEAQRSTYARALHFACVIIGGVGGLASHLGVSEADLLAWLRAEKAPPESVFLSAVEVILLHLDAPGPAA